jgi:hypothetical protein
MPATDQIDYQTALDLLHPACGDGFAVARTLGCMAGRYPAMFVGGPHRREVVELRSIQMEMTMQMSDGVRRVVDSGSSRVFGRVAKQLIIRSLAGIGLALGSVVAALAQAGEEIAPARPSIGADVPVTYFGPPPSSVQRELVGPFQTLKAGKVDLEKGTITLPLYDGALRNGQVLWYMSRTLMTKGTRVRWD